MKVCLQLRQRRRFCRTRVFRRVLITLFAATALAGPPALNAATISVGVGTVSDEYGSGAGCSLREAIQSANSDADFGGCTHSGAYGVDLINIPVGTYTLTRAGIDDDANVSADLDITESVTLSGAGGAGDVVIKGGASYSGRILHVVTGTVVLNNMTLRDGNLPSGRFGAGLRSNPGTTTTLNNVVVGLNTTVSGAGGILNQGEMRLNGSSVTNNVTTAATQSGGGIFNSAGALMVLTDSRVLNNTATVVLEGAGVLQGGGGIFNDALGELDLHNTTVDGNSVDDPGGSPVVVTSGGGILSKGGLQLIQSTVSNNVSRGNDAAGGGIFCGGTTEMNYSLITGNTAERDGDLYDDAPSGGGIQCTDRLTISNSIISNNTSASGGFGGGGLFVETINGPVTISNTTISGNHAEGSRITSPRFGAGGGIMVFGGIVDVVNSTLSGNQADGSGGGIYSDDEAHLYNVTIVDNVSDADGVFGGVGGALAANRSTDPLQAGFLGFSATVMSGNADGSGSGHDDCDETGVGTDQSRNWVQLEFNCFTDTQGRFGDAKLGAFAANGGPAVGSSSGIVAGMGTHAPANDSPLIDAGGNCKDRNDVILTSDQRGQPRPVDGPDANGTATCDIGAVEVQGLDVIFADNFE